MQATVHHSTLGTEIHQARGKTELELVSSKSPHVGWGIPIIQELTCQNLLFILNRWFVPSCSCCVFFLNLACSFLTQFLSLKQIFCVFWFRYLHYEESVHMNDILPFFLCVLKMVSLFRGSGSRKWSNILFLTESFIFPTSGFSRTPILIFPPLPVFAWMYNRSEETKRSGSVLVAFSGIEVFFRVPFFTNRKEFIVPLFLTFSLFFKLFELLFSQWIF